MAGKKTSAKRLQKMITGLKLARQAQKGTKGIDCFVHPFQPFKISEVMKL